MNRELLNGLTAALQNLPSTKFSADEVNEAAINAIKQEVGLSDEDCRDPRKLRLHEGEVFALVEEAIDEILPKKLEGVLGEFAEVKSFARDAEVVFNIEKIGRNRAKLTISKGARSGIYRAAKYDRKYFSLETRVETVAVYVTLEELILGTMSLSELFDNILEGFQESIYKETFNALASAAPVAGYDRISGASALETTKAKLGSAIDKVMPKVKQYGIPTIFGSYAALANIYNPLAHEGGYPNAEDSADIRKYGHVQIYKGTRLVELPNYLIDNSNGTWFYDESFVFVIPSGIKPVKIALRGEMMIKKNESAVGTQKWEANKMLGVGVAMANNFAVIHVSDLGE